MSACAQVPTLLPAGSSLTVVGPTDAVARSAWWTDEPITLVGASAPKTAADFASPTPATLGVFDLHGFTEMSTPEHLDEVWQRRINGANHYEISALPPRYPMLTVMVNHDLAVIHYFASPLGAGAQSRGTLTAAPEVAEFPRPGRRRGDPSGQHRHRRGHRAARGRRVRRNREPAHRD